MPSSLRGLRLNCILAPLVTAAAGIAAILVLRAVHVAGLGRAEEAARTAAIAGLARLWEDGRQGAAPEAWMQAHPGWHGLARYSFDGEKLAEILTSGSVPALREPPPELVLAFQAPRSWPMAGGLACAAPCLPAGSPTSVVVAWTALPPAPPWGPWLWACAAVAVLGGGLGWYLVARIYRPVMWLESAALAAAEGRAEPPGAAESEETASLRSSIATLMAKGRPTDGA